MGCSFPDVCGKKEAAILISHHLLGLGCSREPDSTCCLLRPDFLSAHTSALSSQAGSMRVTHHQRVYRGPAVISQPHLPPEFFTVGRSQMLLLRAEKASQEQRPFQEGLSFLSTSGGCLLFEARADGRILPRGHHSPGLTFSWGQSCPRRCRVMSGDVCGCHNWELLAWRRWGQGCVQDPQSQDSPTEGDPMSMVPRRPCYVQMKHTADARPHATSSGFSQMLVTICAPPRR